MAQLAVVGSNEFIMGFELIGIQRTYEANTNESLKKILKKLMIDMNIGIIVIDENSLEKLEPEFRKNVENNISPVTVVLSKKIGAQSNLRDMIKKAIGVDLW
ncbi:V-type ATP synthase subunit F [archaeon]|jgi:V/A-type H+-transporting ATPase subunit F|nr:V-type ATP synthase subunit F [archaeon]MBT4021882.1 V-type ATP synthase subunit F [archaeon]MBT4272177.1 V-type ATP synthase subunit F [archaeon]MBT4460358.1 V-type ATP synthase subunit F [archaeon]MBT5423315.1 V-type ATP synthase subunit F [archaeon]